MEFCNAFWGFWSLGTNCRVLIALRGFGLELRVLGSGFRVQGLEPEVRLYKGFLVSNPFGLEFQSLSGCNVGT